VKLQVTETLSAVEPGDWNRLAGSAPFLQHAFLHGLHESGCASADTGWAPQYLLLRNDSGGLAGAMPLYLKSHSYGEYVFDWAWADAYQRHGLDYYPKLLSAVPFTPVTGARLLAPTAEQRSLLVAGALQLARDSGLSSLHVLYPRDEDQALLLEQGLMPRQGRQFHWRNAGYEDFEAFLAALSHDKRKKIRQERRKVAQAGVEFRHARGSAISAADWDFFYRCYERTYYEHGNAPYLSRDFFHRMQHDMPQNWLMFTAERGGQPIASSLVALNDARTAPGTGDVAYGRYWGALERVDCLHFEACYYQPLQWCIQNGFVRFEGGAQGEHKMARALLPVRTRSAHWLAHPAFADAVQQFLAREGHGIERYVGELEQRNPFRADTP